MESERRPTVGLHAPNDGEVLYLLGPLADLGARGSGSRRLLECVFEQPFQVRQRLTSFKTEPVIQGV